MPVPFAARLSRVAVTATVLAAVVLTSCDSHGSTGPGPLASVVVTPNPTLAPGATQQFRAVGLDADGDTIQITPTWSVVAGGGTITQAGLFTAGNTPGIYTNTVRATENGVTGSATVTVSGTSIASITITPNPDTTAIGGTQQFTAVARDAQNNVVPITPTWSVVAGGGTISGTGLFTAGTTAGTYTNTIRASSGTVFGTATVVIPAAPTP